MTFTKDRKSNNASGATSAVSANLAVNLTAPSRATKKDGEKKDEEWG